MTFELIKLLIPQFYLNVKEMRGIYEVDGVMLDKLSDGVETVKLNQFVLSSDENTVERLERFFGFGVNQDKLLDERKQHISAYLSGFGVMSSSKVREIIRQFTGDNSDMALDVLNDNNDQALFIMINRGTKEGVLWNQLVQTLSERLPAHLAFVCSLSYFNGSFTADGYTYDEMAQFTHEELAKFIIPIEEVL